MRSSLQKIASMAAICARVQGSLPTAHGLPVIGILGNIGKGQLSLKVLAAACTSLHDTLNRLHTGRRLIRAEGCAAGTDHFPRLEGLHNSGIKPVVPGNIVKGAHSLLHHGTKGYRAVRHLKLEELRDSLLLSQRDALRFPVIQLDQGTVGTYGEVDIFSGDAIVFAVVLFQIGPDPAGGEIQRNLPGAVGNRSLRGAGRTVPARSRHRTAQIIRFNIKIILSLWLYMDTLLHHP